MNKLYFIAALTIFGLTAGYGAALAQEPPTAETFIQEEAVTAKDLGIQEPTLLPSSPFYFFKNFTRGVERLFTFNPVKKLELELRIADEKIAEAKKLAEIDPQRTDTVARAIENYQTSQEGLKSRLQTLKETSQNPNVDRLLEKIADRTVKHEKLFGELKAKFEDKKELNEKLEAAKEKIEEAVAEAAKKDEAKNFAGKIEKALVESKGGDLKHVRSIEIIERIQGKTGGELKDRLGSIRNDFSKRLQEDLEGVVARHQEAAPALIQKTLEALPGDKARRLVIIEEIKNLAEKRVAEVLENTEGVLEKVFEEREEMEKRAAEALKHAGELILKLEEKMKEFGPGVPSSAMRLAGEARLHLEEARKALENKKFGEAFGQARSAEVLARNALRILEEAEEPEDEDLKKDISEIEERLRGWEQRLEKLPEELRVKAKEALENARLHLQLSTETLAKGSPTEAKKHLEEAKSFVRILERIFDTSRRGDEAYRRKLEELEKCGPRPGAPGNWICKDGSWRLLEEKPTPNIPPADVSGGVRKCGVNTFQVTEQCNDGGFKQMYVQCYDGYEERPRSDQCQSSEIWQQKARSICENRCSIAPAPKPVPFPIPKPIPIVPAPPLVKPAPTDTVCTMEYDPVCGTNGKTYSNSCHAKIAGVEIKYRGECGKPSEESAVKPAPTTASEPAPATTAPTPTNQY